MKIGFDATSAALKSSMAEGSTRQSATYQNTEHSVGPQNADANHHSEIEMPVVAQQEKTDSTPQLSSIEMKSDNANAQWIQTTLFFWLHDVETFKIFAHFMFFNESI